MTLQTNQTSQPQHKFSFSQKFNIQKKKLEKTVQKRVRPIGGSLLSGSLDVIVQELKKSCL